VAQHRRQALGQGLEVGEHQQGGEGNGGGRGHGVRCSGRRQGCRRFWSSPLQVEAAVGRGGEPMRAVLDGDL
jgi:hypothetical protein